MSRVSTTILILALAALLAPVKSVPTPSITSRQTNFQLQNALDAQQLNIKFSSLTVKDSCTAGDQACVTSAFAQCVSGKWMLTPCASQTACFALPLVNKPGTSISCDSQADAVARFAAAGVQNGTGVTSSTSTSVSANSILPGANDGDCDDGSAVANVATANDQAGTNTTVAGDADRDNGGTVTTTTVNKRQVNITLFTAPAISSTTMSNSASSSASAFPASSSNPSTFPPSNTFPDPASIQTDIGTTGLSTVTVTTTVTITAIPGPNSTTVSSTAPALSALSTFVSALPLSKVPSSFASSTMLQPASTVVSSTTATTVSNSILPVGSSASSLSSSGSFTDIPFSSIPSVISATSISTSSGQGGFSFVSGAPASTITPGNNNGAVNNGNGAISSSVDVSMLLTATVSSY